MVGAGLDILGAGEGLGTRYITVRVKRIDTDKLAQKIGRAAAAIAVADQLPEPVLRAALPFATNLVRADYGVDLEWQISKVPPSAGALQGNSGLGIGVGAGIGVSLLGWLLFKLF